jgi:hypothetical protein
VSSIDPTCMTYWLPRLQSAGLPVPRTELIAMPEEAKRDIYRLFDGQNLSGQAEPFFQEIRRAAAAIGYPAFLRSSYTSAKHNWEHTCYLANPDQVASHVAGIIEYGEMASFEGLPCDWWAVREFLPTRPLAVCERYGNMPVCRELRVFVKDAQVLCSHPYWPLNALVEGCVEDPERASAELSQISDREELLNLASRAGAAVGGTWSVDVLETARGWYITDMAEGYKSWHLPECPYASAITP